MKKFLLLLLGVVLSLPVLAYDFEYEYKGQTLGYNIIDKEAKTVSVGKVEDVSGTLEIPSKVTFGESVYKVVRIEGETFLLCDSLTSVIIHEGVQEIGPSAFSWCRYLTSVSIPASVISIGSSAFEFCNSLTSIVIPEGITSIEDSTFLYCSGMTYVYIPASVTSIGPAAFAACRSLASITIPDGITTIKSQTFYGCTSLISVTIPEGVTSIGEWAFADCSSLTSVIIPDGVTEIGVDAFMYCESLVSITIPSNVKSIGARAFRDCQSLTSVIYLANTTLVEGNSDIFEFSLYNILHTYATATLYLTEEGMKQYSLKDPWKNFKNVELYDPSGIENVAADFDVNAPYQVYNLSGVKVAEDSTDGLPSGLYLRRQGTITEKIMVK